MADKYITVCRFCELRRLNVRKVVENFRRTDGHETIAVLDGLQTGDGLIDCCGHVLGVFLMT